MGEGSGPQQTPPRVVVVPGTNFNAATSLPLVTAPAARWPGYVVDVPDSRDSAPPTVPDFTGRPGTGSGSRMC